jgi:hypothetical protein
VTAQAREDIDPDRFWRRSDQVAARAVGGDIFLAAPREGSIHALNPMATAVWRALETPRSFRELCALFEAAFPDQDPKQIRNDLSALLKTLEKDGLVSHVAIENVPTYR